MGVSAQETIGQQLGERKKQAEASYRDLVRRVVDGVPFNLDGHFPIITASGRTLEDFQQDVETMIRRREAAGVIEQAEARQPEIERKREEASKLAEEANELRTTLMEKVKEARRQADEAVIRVRWEEDDIQSALLRAEETLLATSASDLPEEEKQLKLAIEQGRRDLHWLMSDIEDVRRQIELDQKWHDENGVTLKDRSTGPYARLQVMEERQQRLEDEILENQKRLAQIPQEKLDPVRQRWSVPSNNRG
jgi:chromosome segregation ATPase